MKTLRHAAGGIASVVKKRAAKPRSIKKRLSQAIGARLIGRSKVTGRYDD